MNRFSVVFPILPMLFFCGCLVGCGNSPKTEVVEQPKVTAEEQAAADEAYNKSMDN